MILNKHGAAISITNGLTWRRHFRCARLPRTCAFTTLKAQRAEGIVVASSVYFNSRREHIIALAARARVPAIYQWREFAVAGGLMSYGANLADMYRQVGIYTGRILRGVAPAHLPIFQPTKFELLLNLQAAKSLGIATPARLLALADEVIE